MKKKLYIYMSGGKHDDQIEPNVQQWDLPYFFCALDFS